MDPQALPFLEVVNRLRRGTLDGKVLWDRAGTYGQQYETPLENGHHARVAATPNGKAVVLVMTSAKGVQTLHLDSSRVDEDVLKLALLQLFVAVRDTVTRSVVNESLDAVKGL